MSIKIKNIACTISMFFLIILSVPTHVMAFSGTTIPDGIGKGIYWTGKGTYLVVEYLVVELFRPFNAITKKMVDVWGVPA